MVPRTSSKAVAVIVGLWVAAMGAAFALATSSDHAAAQQGCGGGGSPSPSSSPSASASEGETFPPIPSVVPSLIPVPAPDQKAAPKRVQAGPNGDPLAKMDDVAAQQQDTCRSTITLTYESGRNPKFAGKVDSEEPMCKRARNVTIKKVKRGADRTVAKTTTNTRGRYSAPARNANGRFYAKVSKATVENRDGETITCGSARSRAIKP